MGALLPWARWTRSTIRASAVSRPTCVARMTNVPFVLSVDPMTVGAGPLLDRDRLAGQHRFVDRRAALDEDPVDRDLLAGPDAQEVARLDGLERHVRLDVAADDAEPTSPAGR